jgi:membrane protein
VTDDDLLTAGVTRAASRLGRLVQQAREGTVLLGRATWRGVVELFYGSDDLTHAAAIAYYALLSFLPFLLLAMSVLGTFPAGREARVDVLHFVLRYFPAQPDFLANNIDQFWKTRIQLGIGGGLGLLWASQGVFGAISTAVNHAWAVERPRSFWEHRWFSLLMMASAGVMLFAALMLLSASKMSGTTWSSLLLSELPFLRVLEGFGSRLVALLLFVLIVGLIFYFVPNTEVRLRDVWPGAFLTAILWRVAYEAFAWYVSEFAQASIHGSIATVVWFLIWIYISAVILLYGVEFTAAIARIRREMRGPALPLNAS